MTDSELDDVYTALCESLSAAGEPGATALLARFALLAMVEIDDAARIRPLIEAAAGRAPPGRNPLDKGGKEALGKTSHP